MLGGQFGQGRRGQMNRVARQVRIGHVTLLAAYGEGAAERAAAAVFHYVTDQGSARGFADDAPVQALLTFAQAFNHRLGTVVRRAFFITGDQKSDTAFVVRVFRNKAFNGDDHRRQAAFHVRRATATEHAVFINQRIEWLVLPFLHRAGGHHIGVSGKAQYGTLLAAVAGPEVVHIFDTHRLDGETAGGKAARHLLLTAFIKRRDGRTTNQLTGKLQRRGEGRGVGGHCGSKAASSGKVAILKQNGGHWPPSSIQAHL